MYKVWFAFTLGLIPGRYSLTGMPWWAVFDLDRMPTTGKELNAITERGRKQFSQDQDVPESAIQYFTMTDWKLLESNIIQESPY